MTYSEIIEKGRDNVFNADHRRIMIEKTGYTEAMRIQVGFNPITDKAEIYD